MNRPIYHGAWHVGYIHDDSMSLTQPVSKPVSNLEDQEVSLKNLHLEIKALEHMGFDIDDPTFVLRWLENDLRKGTK